MRWYRILFYDRRGQVTRRLRVWGTLGKARTRARGEQYSATMWLIERES